MADASRTWSIILALQEQLQTIRVDNGYLTDIGASVWVSDAQRTAEDALGIMIYSGNIVSGDSERARPGKPPRVMTVMLESSAPTALDDAAEQIHAVIEDVEECVARYARDHDKLPAYQARPVRVDDIAILDRPEGLAVVAMQMQLSVVYFR